MIFGQHLKCLEKIYVKKFKLIKTMQNICYIVVARVYNLEEKIFYELDCGPIDIVLHVCLSEKKAKQIVKELQANESYKQEYLKQNPSKIPEGEDSFFFIEDFRKKSYINKYKKPQYNFDDFKPPFKNDVVLKCYLNYKYTFSIITRGII